MGGRYEIASLGRGESLNIPTRCDRCGREELQKTVKLLDPSGCVVWAGTGCAAVLLGMREVDVRRARTEAIAADESILESERVAVANEKRDQWFQFLATRAPGKSVLEAIQFLGGYAAAKSAYQNAP